MACATIDNMRIAKIEEVCQSISTFDYKYLFIQKYLLLKKPFLKERHF